MRHSAYRKQSLVWTLGKLVFAIAVVAAFPLLIIPWHEQQQALEWQAYEAQQQAERAAMLAPFQQAFASGNRLAAFEQCSKAIDDSFSYWHPPQALAWSEDRIEAFVYVSAPTYGLRRLSCTAEGIAQARVDHPLAGLIPLEKGADEAGGGNPWSSLEYQLSQTPADLRSIEFVVRPDDGTLVQRRVYRGDGGWRVETEPPDAPPFPLLSTSPTLLATQSEGGAQASSALPPALKEYPRRRWSSSTHEAFEFLAGALPEDARARIVGLRFDDDDIEVAVAAPVAGLEAPYGDSSFDAWGAATTWMYPREQPPGFGCPVGVALEPLRQAFLARCAEIPGCKPQTHFSIADYSCSQDRGGHWTLHIQSAN